MYCKALTSEEYSSLHTCMKSCTSRIKTQLDREDTIMENCHQLRSHRYIVHRRPSTIMIWYPKFVLTSEERTGLSTEDGVNANAAS